MLPDNKEVHIAEVSNLIVPMIIGETRQNYSEFIAYLLWRIPQIMVTIVKDYNEGARIPEGGIDDPVMEPEEPIEVKPEFTECKVNSWVLTVRAGGDVSYKTIRYLVKGNIVKVYEERSGWSGISPKGTEWVSSVYLTPL